VIEKSINKNTTDMAYFLQGLDILPADINNLLLTATMATVRLLVFG
jgi:hypothetical protein